MTRPSIVNINDVPMREQVKGTRFAARLARLGAPAGMEKLGAQYVVVPAGKTAYPFHSHRNNEELFVIIDGEGTYRRGDERFAIRAGDIIGAPAGGPETAHQIINTSGADLRYLAISTRNDPDVMEYPDSGKFMVSAGIPPGGGMMSAGFRITGRDRPALDYWDGEDAGEEE